MRQDIYNEIETERAYQEEKWGNAFDDTHSPADWWTFVTLYYARYLMSWKAGKPIPVNFRIGLVKVATILVAWIEAVDRAAGRAANA